MNRVYRIDVDHHPEEAPAFPEWYATVVRISDEKQIVTRSGDTDTEALDRATEALHGFIRTQAGYSVEFDDQGHVVSDSVKA